MYSKNLIYTYDINTVISQLRDIGNNQDRENTIRGIVADLFTDMGYIVISYNYIKSENIITLNRVYGILMDYLYSNFKDNIFKFSPTDITVDDIDINLECGYLVVRLNYKD